MKVRDALGDRCKSFEMAEAGRLAMQGLPLLARLDGRRSSRPEGGLRLSWLATASYLIL